MEQIELAKLVVIVVPGTFACGTGIVLVFIAKYCAYWAVVDGPVGALIVPQVFAFWMVTADDWAAAAAAAAAAACVA